MRFMRDIDISGNIPDKLFEFILVTFQNIERKRLRSFFEEAMSTQVSDA